MKVTLELEMPATIEQVEQFCAEVRRVHDGNVGEVLIKTLQQDREEYDTGGTQVCVEIEREL